MDLATKLFDAGGDQPGGGFSDPGHADGSGFDDAARRLKPALARLFKRPTAQRQRASGFGGRGRAAAVLSPGHAQRANHHRLRRGVVRPVLVAIARWLVAHRAQAPAPGGLKFSSPESSSMKRATLKFLTL